jgi:hypothetical protein
VENIKKYLMIYKIEIQEILSKIIEIEADSNMEAISKIEKLYNIEEFVLTSEDYQSTNFIDIEEVLE